MTKKIIGQFTQKVERDNNAYTIETYWLLDDLTIMLDSHEHPRRWMYEREQVQSRSITLGECSPTVQAALERAIKRHNHKLISRKNR